MSRNRGAAIVLAMLIAALAAAVAATVFADQQRWLRRVEHRRDQVQAQALAMAGVSWTLQIIDDDAHRSRIDHLGEPWALTLPPIPLENGEVRGAIVDAQGRLNINALGATDASAEQERVRLARFIAQRGLPPGMLAAMADWIDADGAAEESGGEDAFYLAQPVPRLAANAPVLRVAELGVAKGVTPRMLEAVLPYLSALPAGTPVNVNTASREVLSAIVGNSGEEGLEALIADRARKPFSTVAEFRARLPEGFTLTSDVALSVTSEYFYATIEARQGTTRSRARALLRREGGSKPTIVWQVVE